MNLLPSSSVGVLVSTVFIFTPLLYIFIRKFFIALKVCQNKFNGCEFFHINAPVTSQENTIQEHCKLFDPGVIL